MCTVKPLRPDQVEEIIEREIPEEIINAINNLIIENFKNGESVVYSQDIEKYILDHNEDFTEEEFYNMINAEDIKTVFNKYGWITTYSSLVVGAKKYVFCFKK